MSEHRVRIKKLKDGGGRGQVFKVPGSLRKILSQSQIFDLSRILMYFQWALT